MTTLIGTTRAMRYGAGILDNLLALIGMVAVAMFAAEIFRSDQSSTLNIVIGFGVVGAYFLYYFLSEWLLSTTPGKFFFGLVVRKLDGSRCDANAAFFRTATRFLEVNPFLAGYLPAVIIIYCSERHQRWGDMLADTVVIEANRV